MSAEPPVLEAHDLCASYRHQPVLHGVDVALPKGTLVGLLGPNGAGKSSFLKAVMGELRPDSGWVKLFGQDLNKVRNRIAYVPQRESVDWDFPVTVGDVALMGTYGELGWWRRAGKQERDRAAAALDRVGMTPFAKRPIGELSGGQQQRVFLARALAQDAELLLMDEPFAGVDAATEHAIVTVLRDLREAGRTGPRRTSRPADRAKVFRSPDPAQSPPGRLRAGGGGLHQGKPGSRLRRALDPAQRGGFQGQGRCLIS